MAKKLDRVISEELLPRQVAGLLISGASTLQISKELNISWNEAKRVSNQAETRAMVKEAGESALTAAKAIIRQRMAKLTDQILEVIEKKLEEGDLEAVKIGLKVLGFQQEEPPVVGAQSLTVVLPGKSGIGGASERPIIEVKSVGQDPTDSS